MNDRLVVVSILVMAPDATHVYVIRFRPQYWRKAIGVVNRWIDSRECLVQFDHALPVIDKIFEARQP